MKNKRFWAALLCTAMVLTSQSFNVSAAMQDGLLAPEDTVISTETVGGTESVADDEDNLTFGTEELSVGEEALNDELIVEDELQPIAEDELIEGNEGVEDVLPVVTEAKPEQPEGVDASELFTYYVDGNGRRVLTLKPGKEIKDEIIKIPVDIDVISANLFSGNRKIKSITFDGTVSDNTISSNLIIEPGAFKDSTLESFVAPYNYYTIQSETFSGCSALNMFDFANVNRIEDKAFMNCTAFGEGDNIGWNKKIVFIGMNAFKGSGFINLKLYNIVSANCIIRDYAFEACPELKSISVPSTINVIPEGCFADCPKLTDIDVAASAGGTTVSKFAFKNCTGLIQIGLESFKVSIIEESAFTGCTNLDKLLFPKTVVAVRKNAFENCAKITLIEFHYYDNDTGYAKYAPIIDDYAFPSLDPSKVTMKGYDGKVEEFALDAKHRFPNYVSLLDQHTIKGQSKKEKDKEGKEVEVGFIAGKSLKTNKSNDKARMGEAVEITVSPKSTDASSAWRLRRNSLKDANNGLTTDKIEFVRGDDKSQVFKFTMPNNDVAIMAENGFYLDSHLKEGLKDGITTEIGVYKDEKPSYTKTSGVFYTPHPGKMGQLYVNVDVPSGTYKGNYKLGQWMFTYKSSDTKIATVTETGVVTSHAAGDVEITATYRGLGNWSVKFPINVGPAVDINTIKINPGEFTPALPYWTTVENRNFNGKPYQVNVVTLDESDFASKARDLELKLWASPDTASDQGNYAVNADWISGDSSVAKLAKANTVDNLNKITIPKGAAGSTYIKATYNTHRKDEDDKDIILEAYFIIKIIDITPRATVDDIIVDTNCDEGWDWDAGVTGGTPITIQPVGNYVIDDDSLEVRIGKDRYEAEKKEYTGLKIKAKGKTADGSYRLIFNPKGSDSGIGADSGIGKSKTYSGKNTIWIHGRQKNGLGGTYTDFYIPLNKIIIQNKPLKLAAKMTGQINLWYNDSCYGAVDHAFNPIIPGCFDELEKNDKETYDEYNKRYAAATIGEIKVENNISYETATVRDCQLWSTDHYKKWKNRITGYEDNGFVPPTFTDKFANNFIIDKVDREGTYDVDFVIKRSHEHLSPKGVDKRNGNEYDVVKGYLAIYFKGYTKPVLQSVTLSTKSAAPAYVMSETSTIENSKNSGGEFRFKVLNKTRDKSMISANSLVDLTTGTISTDNIYLDKGSIFAVGIDNEDICLQAKDGLQYGKKTATVNLRRSNWEKAAKYKYTVDYVEKTPTAKLKQSTVNLNWAYNWDSTSTELTLNQANCTLDIEGNTFNYSGSDKLASDASKISISVNNVKNYKNKKKIVVSFNNLTDVPQKGTYKFTFTPVYTYGTTGRTGKLKPMTLNVKVLVNPPKVRFNATTFTFNMYYPDLENKEVTATFSNLPAGVDVKNIKIDTSNIKWELYKSSKDADIANKVAACLRIDSAKTHYDLKKKRWMMTFKMNSTTDLKDRDFNITYDLKDMKINGAPIQPVRITIKGINREPVVSVSAKGTLNVIDYVTPIQYNTKFTNLTGPSFDGTVAGSKVVVWDLGTGKESTILKAKQNKDNPNLIDVTLIDGAEFKDENYKNYEFQLIFKVDNTPSRDITSKPIKVKPAQKTPKIAIMIDKKARRAEFYSGVATANRKVTVDLVKTSQLKTHILNPTLNPVYKGVKIKDTNSEILKSAFTVEYHTPTDETTLTQAIAKYELLPKSKKRLEAGYIVITCTNPELLKSGKVYNLVLETEFDGQLYKTDSHGNWVYDSNKNKIKVNGSTFKVPVVVYK